MVREILDNFIFRYKFFLAQTNRFANRKFLIKRIQIINQNDALDVSLSKELVFKYSEKKSNLLLNYRPSVIFLKKLLLVS